MDESEQHERADIALCLQQIAARLKELEPRSLTPQLLRRVAGDVERGGVRWMEGD